MLSLRKALFTSAAAALACSQIGISVAQEESPWGVRNFEIFPLSVAEFLANPSPTPEVGLVAFWLRWGNVQPNVSSTTGFCPYSSGYPGATDLTMLEERLQFATDLGAAPVLVFHLQDRKVPPPTNPFWALSNSYAGPCDLDMTTPIDYPAPAAVGYSQTLYDVTYEIADYIATEIQGAGVKAYMRFHNEPWNEWGLGSTNLDNYIRCYLTFRRAIEDVEASRGDLFYVGHGSIPRGVLVPRYFYEESLLNPGGLDGQTNLDLLLSRLNAYSERNQCLYENLYGISMPLTNFPDAETYAGPYHAYNQGQDSWMDKFVEWTAEDYFEFTTAHTHGKPYFLELEQQLFDQRVRDYDPNDDYEPPFWLAAEAGFEMHDQMSWSVPDSLPNCHTSAFARFAAEDYARKWFTLAALKTMFCSPVYISSGEYPDYLGLYRPSGNPPGPTGCTSGSCETLPPVCGSAVACEYPANQAFAFLSSKIGKSESTPADLSDDPNAHYRFDRTSDGRYVDVVWRRSMFDRVIATSDVTIQEPSSSYSAAAVYDVIGNTRPFVQGTGEITLEDLGQAPRVIVWTSN